MGQRKPTVAEAFVAAILLDASRRSKQAKAERLQRQRKTMEQRATARRQRKSDVARRHAYVSDRREAAADRSADVKEKVTELLGLLEAGLSSGGRVDFQSWRFVDSFQPSPELLHPRTPPSEDSFVPELKAPTGLSRLIPGVTRRYEAALEDGRHRYTLAMRKHERAEQDRQTRLAAAESAYKRHCALHVLQSGYERADPRAIEGCFRVLLAASAYPDDWPRKCGVTFVPESKELVVEYELPTMNVVPVRTEFTYNQSTDRVNAKRRSESERLEIYARVVSSIALRTLHEVFLADRLRHIATIMFNGYVQAVDRSTGHDTHPCVFRVLVARERFAELDLKRVDEIACVISLGAQGPVLSLL